MTITFVKMSVFIVIFGLKQAVEQGYKYHPDKRDAATGHELFHAL
jgi:hypothetical protein